MDTKTRTHRSAGTRARGPHDPQLRRALLRAMKGALRRSVVLLPLTEDDDRLQECLADLLGVAAWMPKRKAA